MKKVLFILAGVLAGYMAEAQNLITHYSYQLNWFNINPGFAAVEPGLTAVINPHTQWVGMDGNPTNSMFGMYGQYGDNMGLGAKVIVDKRGYFSNFSAEGVYAYTAKIDEQSNLNFGISMGLYQTRLNTQDLINDQYTDASDPTVTTLYFDESQFLSSFGVVYQNKELTLGVSAPHLIVTGRPISDHLFFLAGYKFDIPESKLKIAPSIVHQNITRSPSITDLGIAFEWDERAWFKFVQRTNRTSVFAMGFNVNQFKFSYAYSLASRAMFGASSGSHELGIIMNFNSFNFQTNSVD